ncbi:MAG: hypothetical protein OXC83_10950 [Chloroflexi bacterium]|nr:hypothetical protein [Chloroflexota bacterium]
MDGKRLRYKDMIGPKHTHQPKRKRRPKSDRIWPEPIPDTFENVIDVLANSTVRKDEEWKFLN